jgi:hypothetical protein
MLMYLFLIAAITASSELPTTNTEEKELLELITILTTQDTPEAITENTLQNTPTATEKKVATADDEIITEKIAQPIIITNGIEPSMLAYKHWMGTYSPESFTITINGTEVAQGTQHTLPAETKTIDVSFSYSFVSGMYKGNKSVSYQLNENTTQATITFSWKDANKILIDNGTLLKVTA